MIKPRVCQLIHLTFIIEEDKKILDLKSKILKWITELEEENARLEERLANAQGELYRLKVGRIFAKKEHELKDELNDLNKKHEELWEDHKKLEQELRFVKIRYDLN